MSDDKNYEIHLHFKEPLQVPEAELKDYLDRVPGVMAIETMATSNFYGRETDAKGNDFSRYVITYDNIEDAVPDMDALKRLLDNTPTPVEEMCAYETNLKTGDMTEAPIPGGTFLNFM